MERRVLTAVAVVIALFAITACGSGSDVLEAQGGESLRIASFDFPESELLAELYSQAAESAGIPVTRLGAVGPREIVSPALEGGTIDLVPEYLGTALVFAGAKEAPASASLAAAIFDDLLEPRGLVALSVSPAQDVNVFVVTVANAEALGLEKVSDLAGAGLNRFGGPAECVDRPLCLRGLSDIYGITFEEFIPQSSLMFTVEALRRDEIDVGLLFSTSPELDSADLTALADDRKMQRADNVVPVLNQDALERWGPDLRTALDQVSAELTTDDLRELNRRVDGGESIALVADQWLADVWVTD